MNHKKYDPAMEKLKPGTKVGIVGESHIWECLLYTSDAADE